MIVCVFLDLLCDICEGIHRSLFFRNLAYHLELGSRANLYASGAKVVQVTCAFDALDAVPCVATPPTLLLMLLTMMNVYQITPVLGRTCACYEIVCVLHAVGDASTGVIVSSHRGYERRGRKI